MTSNFYQRRTGPEQIRRTRAVIVETPGQPPRLNVNPDNKPSELAKKSLKLFAIVVVSMITLMYVSVKVLEQVWTRRDRAWAEQTAQMIQPKRDEPTAILSATSPTTPTMPVVPAIPRPAVVDEIARIVPDTAPAVTEGQINSAADKFRWGKLLEEKGELKGAMDLYQESLSINPEDPLVLSQAGRLLIRLSRHSEAVPVLQEARAMLPDNPDIMNDLGVALTFNGQAAEAAALYEALATNHPAYTPALFNHGYALVQLRNYDAARPLLEKYLVSEPENAMALGVLAVLELAQKNYDKALGLLDRAIEISPNWGTPYLDAAGICATTGNTNKALEYLDKALEITSAADVYQQFSSPAFNDIRGSDAGATFQKKIAEQARKAAP